MEAKACSVCGVVRTLDEFYADRRRKDGKQAECAPCCRARGKRRDHKAWYRQYGWKNHIRRKYGLTLSEYENLLVTSCGSCNICGETPDVKIVVDHDHDTGQVRGLLCPRCNHAIGHMVDSAARLRRAADYLEGL